MSTFLEMARRNQRLLTSQDIVDRAAERDRELAEYKRACERGLREANKIRDEKNPMADIVDVWKLCAVGLLTLLLGALAAIAVFWK